MGDSADAEQREEPCEEQRNRLELGEFASFERRDDGAGFDADAVVGESVDDRLRVGARSGRDQAEVEAEPVEEFLEPVGSDPAARRVAVVRACRHEGHARDGERRRSVRPGERDRVADADTFLFGRQGSECDLRGCGWETPVGDDDVDGVHRPVRT